MRAIPFKQRTPCQQWQGLFKPSQLTPYDLSLSTFVLDDFTYGDDIAITSDLSMASVAYKRLIVQAGSAQIVGNTTDPLDASAIGIAQGQMNASAQEVGLCLSAAIPFNGFQLAGGAMSLEWRYRNQTLSNGVDRYDVRIGLQDARSNPTNGIFFFYTDTAGVNWKCVAVRAGVTTTIDSGVPVIVSRYQKLKVTTGVDGLSAAFSIDGNVVAIMSGNQLPATNISIQPIMNMRKTVGVTFAGWQLDYAQFQQNVVAAR